MTDQTNPTNPPTLTGAEPSFFAILDSVGIDTGRAIRTIERNDGPATAWLRANAGVARRAYNDMMRERSNAL